MKLNLPFIEKLVNRHFGLSFNPLLQLLVELNLSLLDSLGVLGALGLPPLKVVFAK